MMGKKTRGRLKIKMEYISDKLKRYTTFSKRRSGIMKKAYELSTLTGTEVLLLVASETGHVYTYATDRLKPIFTSENGRQLIQQCLGADVSSIAARSTLGQHQSTPGDLVSDDVDDMDDDDSDEDADVDDNHDSLMEEELIQSASSSNNISISLPPSKTMQLRQSQQGLPIKKANHPKQLVKLEPQGQIFTDSSSLNRYQQSTSKVLNAGNEASSSKRKKPSFPQQLTRQVVESATTSLHVIPTRHYFQPSAESTDINHVQTTSHSGKNNRTSQGSGGSTFPRPLVHSNLARNDLLVASTPNHHSSVYEQNIYVDSMNQSTLSSHLSLRQHHQFNTQQQQHQCHSASSSSSTSCESSVPSKNFSN